MVVRSNKQLQLMVKALTIDTHEKSLDINL